MGVGVHGTQWCHKHCVCFKLGTRAAERSESSQTASTFLSPCFLSSVYMKELLRGVFMYYTNACSGDTKGEIWYTLVQCQYFLITPVSFFLFNFFFLYLVHRSRRLCFPKTSQCRVCLKNKDRSVTIYHSFIHLLTFLCIIKLRVVISHNTFYTTKISSRHILIIIFSWTVKHTT